MSLPHDRQAGFGALWRRLLGPGPASAVSVLLRLHLRLCQGDDPLLPGGNHVAVAASVRGGFRDGGVGPGPLAAAAPVRVLDLRPDAAVDHADQVCRLNRDKNGQNSILLVTLFTDEDVRILTGLKVFHLLLSIDL